MFVMIFLYSLKINKNKLLTRELLKTILIMKFKFKILFFTNL